MFHVKHSGRIRQREGRLAGPGHPKKERNAVEQSE